MKRLVLRIAAVVVLSVVVVNCTTAGGWKTADRSSAGIAPDPAETPEAVVHVYAADTWGWRGWFAVHTWIAVKKSNETSYRVYDVVGWRARRGRPVFAVNEDIPDRHWYGARPELLVEHRGAGVDELIDKIDRAAHAYPWPDEYDAFPGPNSNTFVAWVAREVPELKLELPFSAIGSGYLD